MDNTPGRTVASTGDTSQTAEQFKAALTSADNAVNQGIQDLGSVHQARLSQATRTAAALQAQYGANDPRVQAAQAAVAATKTTIGRVSMVSRQLAAPTVQAAKAGWALQGHVLDAQLQPAAQYTVFFVDAKKTFQQQYGFAYTDETGYFVINYAGGQAPSATQLFIEVANPQAKPIYLSSTAFQPVLGATAFQNIVLPAGGQPIGDPPGEIRAVALPGKDVQSPGTPPGSSSKP